MGGNLFIFITSKEFILSLIVLILLFLLIREILTWYWKINRIVSLLEDIEINTGLMKINADAKFGNNTIIPQDSKLHNSKSTDEKNLSTVDKLIYALIFSTFLLVLVFIYILTH